MTRLTTRLVFFAAIAALSLVAACGGSSKSTPTAGPRATTGSTATVPAATPGGGDNGSQTPVPDGADNFTLTLKSGPDEGTYVGAYPDASPICLEGGPTEFYALFLGNDLNGTDKFIQLNLLASPNDANKTMLQLTVSEGSDDNVYHISVTDSEGSGTVNLGTQGNVTTATLTGTTAEGPEVELTASCHSVAMPGS